MEKLKKNKKFLINLAIRYITRLINLIDPFKDHKLNKIKFISKVYENTITKLMQYRWNLSGVRINTQHYPLLNIQNNRYTYGKIFKYARFFYYESLNHYLLETTIFNISIQKLRTRDINLIYTTHTAIHNKLKLNMTFNDIEIFGNNYYDTNIKLKNIMFTKNYINAAKKRKSFKKTQNKNSNSYLNLILNLSRNKILNDTLNYMQPIAQKLSHHYNNYKYLKINIKNSIFFKKIFENRIHLSTMINLDRNLVHWKLNFINTIQLLKKKTKPYSVWNIPIAVIIELISFIKTIIYSTPLIIEYIVKLWIKYLYKILNYAHPYIVKNNYTNRRYKLRIMEKLINHEAVDDFIRDFTKIISKLNNTVYKLKRFNENGYVHNHIYTLKDFKYTEYTQTFEAQVLKYMVLFNAQAITLTYTYKLFEYLTPIHTHRLFMCITLNSLNKHYLEFYKQPRIISSKVNNMLSFMKTNNNVYDYFFINKFHYLFLKKTPQLKYGYSDNNYLLTSFISKNMSLLNNSLSINKMLYNQNTFYYPINTHLQYLIDNYIDLSNTDKIYKNAYAEKLDSNNIYPTIYEKTARDQFENKPIELYISQTQGDVRHIYKRMVYGEINDRLTHTLKKTCLYNKLSRILHLNTWLYENVIQTGLRKDTSTAAGIYLLENLKNNIASNSNNHAIKRMHNKTIHNIYKKILLYRKTNRINDYIEYLQNKNVHQLYSVMHQPISHTDTKYNVLFQQLAMYLFKNCIIPTFFFLRFGSGNIEDTELKILVNSKLLECTNIYRHIVQNNVNVRSIQGKLLILFKMLAGINNIMTYLYDKYNMPQQIYQLMNLEKTIFKFTMIRQPMQNNYNNQILSNYYVNSNVAHITQINHRINRIKHYKKNSATNINTLQYLKYNILTNSLRIYEINNKSTLLTIATSIYYLKSKELNNDYNNLSRHNILLFKKSLRKLVFNKNIFINRWKTFRDLFLDLITNYKTIHKEPSIQDKHPLLHRGQGFDWNTIAKYYGEEDYAYPRNIRKTTVNTGLITDIIEWIAGFIFFHGADEHLLCNSGILNYYQKYDFDALADLYNEQEEGKPELGSEYEQGTGIIIDPYLPPNILQHEQDIASHKWILWEIGQTNTNRNIYVPSFFDNKLYYLDYIDYILYKYGIIEMPLEKRILSEGRLDTDFESKLVFPKNKDIDNEQHTRRPKENILDDYETDSDDITINANDTFENEADSDDIHIIKDDISLDSEKIVYKKFSEYPRKERKYFERIEDIPFKQILAGKLGLIQKFTWDVNAFDLDYKLDSKYLSTLNILYDYYNMYLKERNIINTNDFTERIAYTTYMQHNLTGRDIDSTPYKILALRWMIANNIGKLRNNNNNKMIFEQIQENSSHIDKGIRSTLPLLFDYKAKAKAIMFNINKINTLTKPGLYNLNIVPSYIQNTINNEIYLYRKYISLFTELHKEHDRGLLNKVETARAIRSIVAQHILPQTHELMSYFAQEKNHTDYIHTIVLYKNNIAYYNEVILPFHTYIKENLNMFLINAFKNKYDFNSKTTKLEFQKDAKFGKNIHINSLCTFTQWDRDFTSFNGIDVPPEILLCVLGYADGFKHKSNSTYEIIELISECNKQIIGRLYTGPYLDNNSIKHFNQASHRVIKILDIYPQINKLKKQLVRLLKTRLRKNKYINTNVMRHLKNYNAYSRYSYQFLQETVDKHALFNVPISLLLLYIADLPFIVSYYTYIMDNLVKNIDILNVPYIDITKFNKYDLSIYKHTIYSLYSKVICYDTDHSIQHLFKKKDHVSEICMTKTNTRPKKISPYVKLHNLYIERRFLWYLHKIFKGHYLNKGNIRSNLYTLVKLLLIKNNLTNTKLSFLQLDELELPPYLLVNRYYSHSTATPILTNYLHTPTYLSEHTIYMDTDITITGAEDEEDEHIMMANTYYEADPFTMTSHDNIHPIYYFDRGTFYKNNQDKYYFTYIRSDKRGQHYFVRFRFPNINLFTEERILQKTYGHFLATAAKIKKNYKNNDQNYYFPINSLSSLIKDPTMLIDLYCSFPYYHSGTIYYLSYTTEYEHYYYNLNKRTHIHQEHVHYSLHMNPLVEYFADMEGIDFFEEFMGSERTPEPEADLVQYKIDKQWQAYNDQSKNSLWHPLVFSDPENSLESNVLLLRFINSLSMNLNNNTSKNYKYTYTKSNSKLPYILHILFFTDFILPFLPEILSYIIDTESTNLLIYNIDRLPAMLNESFFAYLSGWPKLPFVNEDSLQGGRSIGIIFMDSEYKGSVMFEKFKPVHSPYITNNMLHKKFNPSIDTVTEPLTFFNFEIKANPVLRLFTHVGYRVWDEQLNFMLLLQQNKYWNINYATDIKIFKQLFKQITVLLAVPFNNIEELKQSLKNFNFQDETTPAYIQKYHAANDLKEFKFWLETYAYGLHEFNRFVPKAYEQFFSQPVLRMFLYINFANKKEYSLLVRRSALGKQITRFAPYQADPFSRPEEFFSYPNKRNRSVDTVSNKRLLKRYSFNTYNSPYYFPRTGYESYPYSYASNMLYFHHNLTTNPRFIYKFYKTYVQVRTEKRKTLTNDARKIYTFIDNNLRRYLHYRSEQKVIEEYLITGVSNKYFGYRRWKQSRFPEKYLYDDASKGTGAPFRYTNLERDTGIILNKIRSFFLLRYNLNLSTMKQYGLHYKLGKFFTSQTIKISDLNLLYKPYIVSSTYSNTPIFTLHKSIRNKFTLPNHTAINTSFFVFPKQRITKIFAIDNIYGFHTAYAKHLVDGIVPYSIIDSKYYDLSKIISSYRGYSTNVNLSNATNHAHTYGPLWSLYHKSWIDNKYASNVTMLGKTQNMITHGLFNFRNTVPASMEYAGQLQGTVSLIEAQDMLMPAALPMTPIYYPSTTNYRAEIASDEFALGFLYALIHPSTFYFDDIKSDNLTTRPGVTYDYTKLLMRTLHSIYVPYNTHGSKNFTSYIPIGYDLNIHDLINSNYIKTHYWYHPAFYNTFIKSHPINTQFKAYQSHALKHGIETYYRDEYMNASMFLKDNEPEYDEISSDMDSYNQYAVILNETDRDILQIPLVNYLLTPELQKEREKLQEEKLNLKKEKIDKTIEQNYNKKLYEKLESIALFKKITSWLNILDSKLDDDSEEQLDARFRYFIYKETDIASSFDWKQNVKNMYSMEFDPFFTENTTHNEYLDPTFDQDFLEEQGMPDYKKLFGKNRYASYGYDKRPDIMHPLTRSHLPGKIYGQPTQFFNNAPIYTNRYKFINIFENFRMKPFTYLHNMKMKHEVNSAYISFFSKEMLNKNINKFARSYNKIIHPLESQWSTRRATLDLFILDMQYLLSHRMRTNIQKHEIDYEILDDKYGDMWVSKYGRYYPNWPPTFHKLIDYGIRSKKKHAYQKFKLALTHPYNLIIQSAYHRPSKNFFPTTVMSQYANTLGFDKTKNWIHGSIPKEANFVLHENFYKKENFPQHLIKNQFADYYEPFMDDSIDDETKKYFPEFVELTRKEIKEYMQHSYERVWYRYPPIEPLINFLNNLYLEYDANEEEYKKLRDWEERNFEVLFEVPSTKKKTKKNSKDLTLTPKYAKEYYINLYPTVKQRSMLADSVVFNPDIFEPTRYIRTHINKTHFSGFLNQHSKRLTNRALNSYCENVITVHKNQDVYKMYNLGRQVLRRMSSTLMPDRFIKESYSGEIKKDILSEEDISNMLIVSSQGQSSSEYSNAIYKYAVNRIPRRIELNLNPHDSMFLETGYVLYPDQEEIQPVTSANADYSIESEDITFFRNISRYDYQLKGGKQARENVRAADTLVYAIKPKKYSKETYNMLQLIQALSNSKQIRLMDTAYNVAFDKTKQLHHNSHGRFILWNKKLRRAFRHDMFLDGIIRPKKVDTYRNSDRASKQLFRGGVHTIPFKDSYWLYIPHKLPEYLSNKYHTQELVTYKMDSTKPIDWTELDNLGATSVRGTFTEKQFIYNYKINNPRYSLPLVDYFYYTQYSVDKTFLLNIYKYHVFIKNTPTIFEEHSSNIYAFVPDYRQKSFVFKFNSNLNNHIHSENIELFNILNLVINDISVKGLSTVLDSYLYANSFTRPMTHWFLKIYYNNIYYFDAFYSYTCDFLSSIMIF